MSKEDRYFPTLRFPEFSNLQGWKERKLHEILFEHKQKSTGTEEVFSVSVHKGVINQIEHLGRSFSAANTDHYKRVLPGDVIYTKSPTGDFPYGIIKQSKVATAVIVSPLYGVFKPETVAVGYLLDSYFESVANTTNYLSSIVQKGAKNTINIHNDTFLSKGLILPDNQEEQQKIADCLSSLDDVITAQAQKLDLLRAHKKGLMQDLFPAEGESVPRLRFGEFNNLWKKEMLGNHIAIKSGLSPSSYSLEFDGCYPFVKVEDLNNCEKYQVISREYSNDVKNIVPRQSIIFPKRGAAISTNKVRINSIDILIDTNLMAVTPTKSVLVEFLYYSILRIGLYRIADTSTIPQINNKHIEPFEMLIPSLQEQQKIADCLTALDDQIQAQTQKIESLKLHKKGLMQQLFPNPNP